MIKRVVFSVGISIIIAVASGYFFSQEKFFYLIPGKSKSEVTEKLYNEEKDFDSEYLSKEVIFNTEKAFTIGLASLGVLLILSAAIKNKKRSLNS
jgi:hypothetical protein